MVETLTLDAVNARPYAIPTGAITLTFALVLFVEIVALPTVPGCRITVGDATGRDVGQEQEMDMGYEWTITKDLLAQPTDRPGTNMNAVGVVGPRGAKHTSEEIRKDKRARVFRMLDDDREVYYEGCIVSDEPGSEDDFGPLDDFGTPNAGAVIIQYRRGNAWVTL